MKKCNLLKKKSMKSKKLSTKSSLVSYPHEWPAALLKDVVLACSNPLKGLATEQPFLDSKLLINEKRLKNDRDFISYALTPLMLMAHKEHQQAREILKNHLGVKNTSAKKLECGRSLLPSLLQIIEELEVSHKTSEHAYKKGGYATYYSKKKEFFSLSDQAEWGNKQKNIYKILKQLEPQSVLDLGANTGWFSLLAESIGAEVVATDIDEASVNILYGYVKQNKLNILPLVLPFEDYVKNSRLSKSYVPAIKRMKADVVLCLALIHHLVFMSELTLEQIFPILADITKQTLVLEFVTLDDEQVQNALTNRAIYKSQKEFDKGRRIFATYGQKNYNLKTIMSIGMQYFSSVEILESHPDTRKLLVFSKLGNRANTMAHDEA